MKGLEALEKLEQDECVTIKDFNECYDIIEKELKVLEIIKRNAKIVDYSEHNGIAWEELIILQGFKIKSKEEYDLLKEVLL